MPKKPHAPRFNKSAGDRQVEAIIRLLVVWPQATTAVIEQYVTDQCNAVLTRAALQEAKKSLGLLDPAYTQHSVEKRAVVRYATLNLLNSQGPYSQKRSRVLAHVSHCLREQFDEGTNPHLLKNWVDEVLNSLGGEQYDKQKLHQLAEDARDELRRLGILDTASGQRELL